MRRTLSTQRGLSLTEVTIMLSVLSVLTAVLSPTVGDYVEDARRVKASEDVQVLASVFARFTFDVPFDRHIERGRGAPGGGVMPSTCRSSTRARQTPSCCRRGRTAWWKRDSPRTEWPRAATISWPSSQEGGSRVQQRACCR